MQKITTFLWFDDKAEEAAQLLHLDIQEFEDRERLPATENLRQMLPEDLLDR